MYHRIFIRILIIAGLMLADQLHENGLVVYFPDAGIEFQEQVGCRIIAEEKTAVSVADKIFVVPELRAEIFPEIHIDGPPHVKIIEGSTLEWFKITCSGHSRETTGRYAVLK